MTPAQEERAGGKDLKSTQPGLQKWLRFESAHAATLCENSGGEKKCLKYVIRNLSASRCSGYENFKKSF